MTAVRRTQLTRLAIWIGVATFAVFAAVLAARTETGVRRIATLLAPPQSARTSKAPQLANRQSDQEAEQRRLSEAVRTLAADRDRLLARLNTLERNLEDVTGSIPPANAIPKPPAASATAAQPAPATTSSQARVASGHLATGAPSATESTATKTEFGVDLGGNASVEGLRTLWTTLKTAQPGLLEGLRPLIAIREAKPGGVELRLVAGPLPNASLAARLCAALAAVNQACQTTVFDGQRLALQ